jgi:hypothetical protein
MIAPRPTPTWSGRLTEQGVDARPSGTSRALRLQVLVRESRDIVGVPVISTPQ